MSPAILWAAFFLPIPFLIAAIRRSRCCIYLLDFACYKPSAAPPDGGGARACTRRDLLNVIRHCGSFSDDSVKFTEDILEKGGLGDSTYLPEALLAVPMRPSLREARRETETAMFGAIDGALAKAGVRRREIGILVVNCSAFSVVPSLAAVIVNRYRLGDHVLAYNLIGMGCSGGLSAVELARDLLRVHPNRRALVVSTENTALNAYQGNDRSMILLNCLFRVGAAAAVLSNHPSDRRRAMYRLLHTAHAHTAASDRSYRCIYQREDGEGRVGFAVSKDLMTVSVEAIEAAVRQLGRRVLPVSEQLRYAAGRAMGRLRGAEAGPSVPSFGGACEHFLPHVGGRMMLDELQRGLGLDRAQTEASRMTLYRFGNTSSSSVWYELAYVEAKGRVRRGDRVWMMAFGSGFTCTNAVWRAMRTVRSEAGNPWMDEIDGFPVDEVQRLTPLSSSPYYFEPALRARAA